MVGGDCVKGSKVRGRDVAQVTRERFFGVRLVKRYKDDDEGWINGLVEHSGCKVRDSIHSVHAARWTYDRGYESTLHNDTKNAVEADHGCRWRVGVVLAHFPEDSDSLNVGSQPSLRS